MSRKKKVSIIRIIFVSIISILLIYTSSGFLLLAFAWRGFIDCPYQNDENYNMSTYKFQDYPDYKGLTCVEAVWKYSKENYIWINNFVFIGSVIMLILVIENDKARNK